MLAAAIVSAWATLPIVAAMPAWMRMSIVPALAPTTLSSSASPARATPHPTLEVTETIGAATRESTAQPRFSTPRLWRLMWWLWALGTVVSGGALLVGLARLRRIAAAARDVESPIWTTTRDELQHAFGLSSGLRLLQSDHPSLLVTWGWRRPTILLPVPARTWSEERINVVLAHECAHIARRDWVVQVAAEALCACCWFNPLIWLACGRLRHESERACDDVVLTRGISAASYADHLLDLTRRLHPAPRGPLPALAMARRYGLEGRIVAMLNSSLNRRPASRQARLVISAALVMLTLSVAAIHAQPSFYSLDGTVRDPSNRVLPDTTLVLTNAETSAKYEVRANAVGHFEFVGLPPASYTLTANRLGFSNLNETLKVSGNLTRDIRLKVGDLQETINVTDRSVPASPADPVIQQRRAAAQRKFEELSARAKAQCASGVDGVVGGSILPPAKLVDVRPVYPEHLKSARVGGVVTMDAVIGTDGLVREIDNVHGPDPALEQAAAEAVRQWQFSTTLLNCEPIDVNMHVTTNFRVEP